ncbi:hypothetical protein TNCV_4515171 [Trichonephila clavipes]|nr:hypothetical protein TNCV_4515171 [Trichonephila clavipes]
MVTCIVLKATAKDRRVSSLSFYFVGLYLTSAYRGFRRSSIPYEEFEDEPGYISEEVKVEPKITEDNIGHMPRGGDRFILFLKMLFGLRPS